MKIEEKSLGQFWGVVSGFSLGWKCVIATDMYFPKVE
jgi:hypothetical protein